MPDGKVNILIVDDRPEKLVALEAVLADLDVNLVKAHSGKDALRRLLNDEFAVILLDINMPGLDGFETAALIRQRKQTEHVPIIFVTAFSDELHVSRGYSLGAVDYILAPVVPDVLRTKVGVFVELYRKTEQVRLQAEALRRRAAQLQKLAAASVAINGALSMDKMLRTITDTARDVIGSHQAITFFILDPGTPHRPPKTQSVLSCSPKYAQWDGKPLDLDVLARSLVVRSPTPTRLTEAELRQHPDWELVQHVQIPPIHGGMLAAPLTGRDGSNLGVIYLSDRSEGEFTNDDEAVLVQLAQMGSIAIENTIFAEAREANRVKDEFLATLSHELRTPLNAMLGWTRLLRTGKLDEADIAHGLEVIERNVGAQAKLIEDLLDVSRIMTGKLRLNVRPMSMVSVVEAAIDAVHPAADAKEITLHANLDRAADAVTGDADRMQQVVWNLLTNAIKFSGRSGRVEVTLKRHDGYVQLRVTDNGIGIDPKFLPHVFERFRQADSSSTRAHGGLGIGLALVRHVVESHGGTVGVESFGPGHGATFTVNLPVNTALTVSAPQPPLRAANRPLPAAPTDSLLAGLSVLVVDDDADALEMLGEALRRQKAEVCLATSTSEALTALAHVIPHVLISDIAMPGEDGYALIRAVRSKTAEQGGQVPALALTAYAREEDRARVLAAGFQMHLSKPVEPAELANAIASLAGRTSPEPALKCG